MDEIYELIAVLTRKRLKESLIFPQAAVDDQRIVLYRILKTEERISDEEACTKLFGDLSYKPKYFAVKAQLKQQLLQTLLRFDVGSAQGVESSEAQYQCITKYAQAAVLQTFGAQLSAQGLLEQVLKLSEEFHITRYNLLSLQHLSYIFSISSDKRSYQRYSAEFVRVNKLWMAELESERYMSQFAAYIGRSKKTFQQGDPAMDEITEKLKMLRSEYPDSVEITMHYLRVKAYSLQGFRLFDDALAYCDEAIDFMAKHKKLFSPANFGEFYYISLQCAIAQRQYDLAQYYAQKAEESFQSKGRHNHLLVLYSLAVIAIHTSDFQRSTEICNEVFSNGWLNTQDEEMKEYWMLLRAELIFASLTELCHLHPRTRANLMKDFSITSFLISLPVYSADKQGGNIVVQLIQVMLYLSQGNIEGARSRIESLRQYRLSYVNAREHHRSHIMFKLLTALLKSDFDTEYVGKKHNDLVEQLHSKDPQDPASFLEGMEIIPYDVMWDHCVSYIENLHSSNRLLRPLPRNKRER